MFRSPPAFNGAASSTSIDAGRVVGFVEKPRHPRSDLVNAGMYMFAPSVLDEAPWRAPLDIGYDLLPRRRPGARAVVVDGYFRGHRDARTRTAGARWSGRRRGMARMIITQTPLRIGLLGGGTDLPEYAREHGGRVLNCAIDKYLYVIVKQRFDDDIYINYSRRRSCPRSPKSSTSSSARRC